MTSHQYLMIMQVGLDILAVLIFIASLLATKLGNVATGKWLKTASLLTMVISFFYAVKSFL